MGAAANHVEGFGLSRGHHSQAHRFDPVFDVHRDALGQAVRNYHAALCLAATREEPDAVKSRTSDSEGGPGKPTSRKADRGPWPDPYTEHRTG